MLVAAELISTSAAAFISCLGLSFALVDLGFPNGSASGSTGRPAFAIAGCCVVLAAL